jgi:hypothetical protein
LLEQEGFPASHWLASVTPDADALALHFTRLRDASDIPLEAIESPMLLMVGADEDPDRDAAVTGSLIAGSEIVWLAGLGHLGVFLDAEQSVARGRPFLERSTSTRFA